MRGHLVGVMPLVLLCALSGCGTGATVAPSTTPKVQHLERVARSVESPAHPSVRHPPQCTADDLYVRFRPKSEGGVDGAGGHLITALDFRNIGASPCVLSGYPHRVTVLEPGLPPIKATNGSFFPVVGVRKPLDPGGVTTLGVETDSLCLARPTGGPPGPMYRGMRISLPGGAIKVVAPPGRAIDAGCGVHLTKFTIWN